MSHQLSPAIIASDFAALKAIEELVDYQSVNPTYSVAHLQQLRASYSVARENRERLQRAYEQARVIEIEASLLFHASMVGARNHVIVQYGDDSYAAAAVGRKRRSERKRPTRKAAKASAA